MNTLLTNATLANLENLGFNYPNLPGSPGGIYDGYLDYRNYPWALVTLSLYTSTGSLVETISQDQSPNVDMDQYYISPGSNPPLFISPFGNWNVTTQGLNNASPTNVSSNYAYNPLPADGCEVVQNEFYTVPDGNTSNDWDNLCPLTNTAQGVFSGLYTENFNWTTINPGTYVVAGSSVLVGRTMVPVLAGVQAGTANCSNGTTTTTSVTYTYLAYHMQPSFFLDQSTSSIAGIQGYGLASNQSTSSFIIEQGSTTPLPNNTPPTIVAFSEYPSDGASLAPNAIGPSNYLKVMLSDNEGSGSTNYSNIILTGPNGNQIPGQISWNGGTPGTTTWGVYFIPASNLTLGGTYSWIVTPVDQNRNIGIPTTFTFSIVDTSIPVINAVSANSSAGQTTSLSSSTQTQINFFVSGINAVIIPGSSNSGAVVNWVSSTVQVLNSANQAVAGTLSHTAGTNILSFIPSVPMQDGNYDAIITPASINGYSGAYQYKFNISTGSSSTVTYVDLSGTGDSNSTYMIISANSAGNSGITDPSSNTDPASIITVSSVASSSMPAPPAGYKQISTAVTFGDGNPLLLPLTFNANLCTVTLVMHFTSNDIAQLASMGLSQSDLTVWMYDGLAWHQITNLGSIVNTGTDNYVEATLTSLTQPLNQIVQYNVFAFMYVQPSTTQTVYHFQNTKVFNPDKGPAKIYLGVSSLVTIQDIKCYIFNMAGTFVRTVEYTQNPAPFSGFDADPITGINNYYFSWDGKNDAGSLVRNGIYVLKMQINYTNGTSQKIGRTIAVIK
jgi:hypothetical protein